MTGFGYNVLGFGGGEAVDLLPTLSTSFTAASNQNLTIDGADFGTPDSNKFAISVWIKTGASNFIFDKSRFRIEMISGKINVNCTNATTSGAIAGSTSVNTDTFAHIYVKADMTLSAADRIKIYVDGSLETNSGTDPSGTISWNTASARWGAALSGSDDYDGLMYQMAVYSGTLPDIADVYDSGQVVIPIAGLLSNLSNKNGDVTKDNVLSTAWTNNGVVVTSATIPTQDN